MHRDMHVSVDNTHHQEYSNNAQGKKYFKPNVWTPKWFIFYDAILGGLVRASKQNDTKPSDNDDNEFDKYLETYLSENPKSKIVRIQPSEEQEVNESVR